MSSVKVIDFLKTGIPPDEALGNLAQQYGIAIHGYPDRVVLNYGIDSSRVSEIARECRGLILSYPDFNIMSRSFDRFFNYKELPETLDFNIERAIVYEKIDGSLMNLYWDGNAWCVATRKMAFAEGVSNFETSYKNLFLRGINSDSLDNAVLDKAYTYIFELVSPENKIVKSYGPDTKLYYLCCRHKETGKYIMPVAGAIPWNVCTPFEYVFSDFSSIEKSFENMPVTDEGYVAYDPVTERRIKLKNPAYVALHHQFNNGKVSEKDFISLIRLGEIAEFLAYFPEYTGLLEECAKKYYGLITRVKLDWDDVKAIEDQKEFALAVANYKTKSLLFTIKKTGISPEDIVNNLEIKPLLRLL